MLFVLSWMLIVGSMITMIHQSVNDEIKDGANNSYDQINAIHYKELPDIINNKANTTNATNTTNTSVFNNVNHTNTTAASQDDSIDNIIITDVVNVYDDSYPPNDDSTLRILQNIQISPFYKSYAITSNAFNTLQISYQFNNVYFNVVGCILILIILQYNTIRHKSIEMQVKLKYATRVDTFNSFNVQGSQCFTLLTINEPLNIISFGTSNNELPHQPLPRGINTAANNSVLYNEPSTLPFIGLDAFNDGSIHKFTNTGYTIHVHNDESENIYFMAHFDDGNDVILLPNALVAAKSSDERKYKSTDYYDGNDVILRFNDDVMPLNDDDDMALFFQDFIMKYILVFDENGVTLLFGGLLFIDESNYELEANNAYGRDPVNTTTAATIPSHVNNANNNANITHMILVLDFDDEVNENTATYPYNAAIPNAQHYLTSRKLNACNIKDGVHIISEESHGTLFQSWIFLALYLFCFALWCSQFPAYFISFSAYVPLLRDFRIASSILFILVATPHVFDAIAHEPAPILAITRGLNAAAAFTLNSPYVLIHVTTSCSILNAIIRGFVSGAILDIYNWVLLYMLFPLTYFIHQVQYQHLIYWNLPHNLLQYQYVYLRILIIYIIRTMCTIMCLIVINNIFRTIRCYLNSIYTTVYCHTARYHNLIICTIYITISYINIKYNCNILICCDFTTCTGIIYIFYIIRSYVLAGALLLLITYFVLSDASLTLPTTTHGFNDTYTHIHLHHVDIRCFILILHFIYVIATWIIRCLIISYTIFSIDTCLPTYLWITTIHRLAALRDIFTHFTILCTLSIATLFTTAATLAHLYIVATSCMSLSRGLPGAILMPTCAPYTQSTLPALDGLSAVQIRFAPSALPFISLPRGLSVLYYFILTYFGLAGAIIMIPISFTFAQSHISSEPGATLMVSIKFGLPGYIPRLDISSYLLKVPSHVSR